MTREEAIYIIDNLKPTNTKSSFDAYVVGKAITMAIESLSAEPCEDAISRQAVIDYIDKMPSELTADGRRMIRRRTLEKYISDTLPSVTPKQEMGRWIPIKTRPMTEEEKEHYRELGWDDAFLDTIYDCDLPEDGQTVLITTRYGEVQTDTFYADVEGALFETYSDVGDVLAWMQWPEPWKGEEDVRKPN